VFGPGPQEDAWTWIDQGLVHFVSSDGHNTARRPVKLRFAYEAIARDRGAKLAKALLVDNPKAAFDGAPCPMCRNLRPIWKGERKSDFSFFEDSRRQDLAGCKGKSRPDIQQAQNFAHKSRASPVFRHHSMGS